VLLETRSFVRAFAVTLRVVLGVAALAIGIYRLRYLHMDPRYAQMGFVFFAIAAYFFWRAWQSYTNQR
jgi:membrane protein implicated in regulation of membrane protease activity